MADVRKHPGNSVPRSELQKVSYLNFSALRDRACNLLPFWDGERWHTWLPVDGELIPMRPRDMARSSYVAHVPAQPTDLCFPFLHFLWQRACWADVNPYVAGLCEDIANLSTSVAKIRLFHASRNVLGGLVASVCAETEVEYIGTVARSMFDLIQEAISVIWCNHIELKDPIKDRLRKQRRLPKSFADVAMRGDEPLSAEDIDKKFNVGTALAEVYAATAPVFVELRKIRNRVLHGPGTREHIFSTERGFCVDPTSKPFNCFDVWEREHYYNDRIASLLPWLVEMVGAPIISCNLLTDALSRTIQFPEEIAPGLDVYFRWETAGSLKSLLDLATATSPWWDEPTHVAETEP